MAARIVEEDEYEEYDEMEDEEYEEELDSVEEIDADGEEEGEEEAIGGDLLAGERPRLRPASEGRCLNPRAGRSTQWSANDDGVGG
jgi:hypothetical protein